MKKCIICIAILVIAISSIYFICTSKEKNSTPQLLNVSYDPTRELYFTYNLAFQKYWKEKTGKTIDFALSNGGSGKQARSIIAGLDADVATLALEYDIDKIASAGVIDENWRNCLPNHSVPYTSPIVFLVRKGNPKDIHDWSDLVKENVGVVTASPKTSGGARWNYLAAWGFAERHFHNNDQEVKQYMKDLFNHVVILDASARAATTSFIERKQGDVLITWENEAYLALRDRGDEVEIIVPSISISAEPSVAVVDEVVSKKGTKEVATAYLEYLYSDIGQTIIGENYYRPINLEIASKFSFKPLSLLSIDKDFGGWAKAQKTHFDDGGTFDQIYNP